MPTHDAVASEAQLLRCYPEGFCSWRYRVEGAGHDIRVTFNHFGEQGSIHLSDKIFEIKKNGMFRGEWKMLHEGAEVANAKKLSAFSRHFELTAPGISTHEAVYQLTPDSALGRAFRLHQSDVEVARIYPDHAFTRRATIALAERNSDVPTLCFAFWLVVLTWVRASQSA